MREDQKVIMYMQYGTILTWDLLMYTVLFM